MIGYYVHHQGAGHLARAMAITRSAADRFTLLGTGLAGLTGSVAAIDLPDDRPVGATTFDGEDGAADRPHALHYAPLNHEGVRARAARLAGWIGACRPSLFVVDVSAEVAMLARLAATPTLLVRLAGNRTDPAHLDAFRGATALLAPFHPDLEDPATPDWVRAKTRYAPRLAPPVPAAPVDEAVVVVVFGAGGGQADGDSLAEAARRTPHLRWRILGPMSPPAHPPANLVVLGWVCDADTEIARAGVVVGSAGDGVVAAVLGADRPFICLPQPRPFNEQRSRARALAAQGAALCLEAWPAPDAWPGLLQAARQQVGGARRRLSDGDDADTVRDWILEIADLSTTEAGTRP